MARTAKKSPQQWKEEIMRTAQALFAAKGYDETSISDIMREVGAAKGMFYHFFAAKEQLLNELVEHWAQSYAAMMSAALRKSGESFPAKLQGVLGIIEEMSRRTAGMEAFFHPSNESMLNRLTRRMTAIFIPQFAEMLASGVEEGYIDLADHLFYARFIIYGALGALNAGEGPPHENIPKNLTHLPKAIESLLNLGSAGRKGRPTSV